MTHWGGVCSQERETSVCHVRPTLGEVHSRAFPSLFPPPIFDCLQYASTEGEGLGDEALSGTISLRARGQSISKAASILFTIPGTFQHKTGITTDGHHPPCVYPLST